MAAGLDLTFAGGGLERAAHLRGDADRLAELRAAAGARAVVLWRGQPLVSEAGAVLIAPDHPVIAGAPWLFLGLQGGAPRFAADLSAWQPPPDAVSQTESTGPFAAQEIRHPELGREGAVFADLRAVMAALPAADAELLATARGLFAWHDSHGFCARCGAPSRLSMAGWQRQCDACASPHFPRTDPVVIMLVTHGNSALLGRSPGWPDGMYSALAGFMEPGETIEAAVRREVAEEAGVPVGRVRYLASQPWPFPASLMIGCLAEAEGRQITLDPAELEDACWLTREEMAEVYRGAHPTVRPPRKGAIAEYLLRGWLADRWSW